MSIVIGIDLGGTKIGGVLWDANTHGARLSRTILTQSHEGPEGVIRRIADHIRSLCVEANIELADVAAVGVGVPATHEAGVIGVMPNLPGEWAGKPLAALLREQIGRPVTLVNDARAFTLAEATIGAGAGTLSCVGITLGTGIGGGIAINGRLYLGTGSAGEFGHHSIEVNGQPDGTGNPGGWEGMASGPAIAALGMKAVAQGINTLIGDLIDFDLNQITPEVIAHAAGLGDPVARQILATAGEYLGTGIANIIIMLAPECVVIGGSVARLGEWIMKPIEEAIRRRVYTVPPERVRIVAAALGGDAGAIGAAIWASQQEQR
jgi:glucokinase